MAERSYVQRGRRDEERRSRSEMVAIGEAVNGDFIGVEASLS